MLHENDSVVSNTEQNFEEFNKYFCSLQGKKGGCVIMSFNNKTPFILNEDCIAALN